MTYNKTPATGVKVATDELEFKDLEQVVGGIPGDLGVEVNVDLTQLAKFICKTMDHAIKAVQPCHGGPVNIYCIGCIYHEIMGGGAR